MTRGNVFDSFWFPLVVLLSVALTGSRGGKCHQGPSPKIKAMKAFLWALLLALGVSLLVNQWVATGALLTLIAAWGLVLSLASR